ncbi:MAG: hypothetical protein IJW55_03560 [Clostridia bacterium]|nr:hypothetical protein [Clostridia bacterium]
MKNKRLVTAIGYLDDELIAETGSEVSKKKQKSGFAKWGTLAASLCLSLGLLYFAAWFFLPTNLFGTRDEVLRMTMCRIEDCVVSYTVEDDESRFAKLMLENQMGDVVAQHGERKFYRLKGKEDLVYLITKENDQAEPELLCFSSVSHAMTDEEYRQWVLYESGYMTDEDIAILSAKTEVTYADVFALIYGVSSADEIQKIKVEKNQVESSAVAKRVEIKTLTLKNDAEVNAVYEAFSSAVLDFSYANMYHEHRVSSYDEAYLNGEAPLSAQTERKITLFLESGREVEIKYAPTGNVIWQNQNDSLATVDDTTNATLIELFGIDTEYRDWGTNPVKETKHSDHKQAGDGCETATVPSVLPVS